MREVHYNLGLLHIQQRHWVLARQSPDGCGAVSHPHFIEARRAGCARLLRLWRRTTAKRRCWPTPPTGRPNRANRPWSWPPCCRPRANSTAALGTLATRAACPTRPAAGMMRLRIAAQRAALYERSNQLEQRTPRVAAIAAGHARRNCRRKRREARAEGWSAHAALAMRAGATAAGRRAVPPGARARPDDDQQPRQRRVWAGYRQRPDGPATTRRGRPLQTAHAAQLAIARDVVPELLAAGQ